MRATNASGLALAGLAVLHAACTSGAGRASDAGARDGDAQSSADSGATGSDSGNGSDGGGGSDGSADAGSAGDAAGTDAGAPTGWGTPVDGGPSGSGPAIRVTVDPSTTVGAIGPGFAGFSYEKTHITNDSLNVTNSSLVALHTLLGTPVIRLGADDVDNCFWAGAGAPPPAPSGAPFTLGVTTGMVDELCSFLAATGSQIIYGVNFKKNDVQASAAEAAYVQHACGPSIYGFEIGNEINFVGSWASLQTQWEEFATAIAAVPGARIIGPAVLNAAQSFTAPFAASESAKFGDKLALLTEHYYENNAGALSNADATALLQAPTSGLATTVSIMNTIASANKIPDGYRLGECNTFTHHGQMGVSDALIEGLWSIDVMFATAEQGGGGVNFHGAETGQDGTVPFYYEPIKEQNGAVVSAQPEYYGMLLFSLAGEGAVLSTANTSTSTQDLTAYAVKANEFTSVVIDNKNATTGFAVTVDLGSQVNSASAIYLQGTPAGDLAAGAGSVTLAGAQVTPTGAWPREPPYVQATSGNTVSVYVPPASAALVRIF